MTLNSSGTAISPGPINLVNSDRDARAPASSLPANHSVHKPPTDNNKVRTDNKQLEFGRVVRMTYTVLVELP